ALSRGRTLVPLVHVYDRCLPVRVVLGEALAPRRRSGGAVWHGPELLYATHDHHRRRLNACLEISVVHLLPSPRDEVLLRGTAGSARHGGELGTDGLVSHLAHGDPASVDPTGRVEGRLHARIQEARARHEDCSGVAVR